MGRFELGVRWCSLLTPALVLGLGVVLACAPPDSSWVFETLAGGEVDPLEPAGPASVLVFVRSDCPISNRYAPEFRRLHERFAPAGLEFWLVYVDPSESSDAIRAHLADYELPMGALRDPQHRLVERAGVRVTPEAAVFGRGGGLIYRGRIDDRYVDFGRMRAAPTRRELELALAAIVANAPVTPPSEPAIGCVIADLK